MDLFVTTKDGMDVHAVFEEFVWFLTVLSVRTVAIIITNSYKHPTRYCKDGINVRTVR